MYSIRLAFMAQSDRARPKDLSERVQQDVARGDYGLARTRLLSHLQQQGYSADLLARIGRLSFDMHDLTNAGRYWLISNAEGPEVDAAVRAFADRCGCNAGNMVSQLPQAFRQKPMASYPPVVQARLGRFGIDERCLVSGSCESGPGQLLVRRRKDKAIELLAWTLFIGALISMFVGVFTIIGWLL